MTNIEYIYSEMKDVTGKTPILLVGGAVTLFKKIYRGNIVQLHNTDDVKSFMLDYYNVEYDRPLVIEDISDLVKDSILLKIVESTNIPLILLASVDNFGEPLLSRIKTVIKLPSDLNFENKNVGILDVLNNIISSDMSKSETESYISDNQPKLLPIYDHVNKSKYQDKIIQIYGGLDS